MLSRHTFTVDTNSKVELVDITPLVIRAVESSDISEGLATIILKHTSASLSVQEFEPNLVDDFKNFLDSFVLEDLEDPHYRHNQLWRRPGVPPDEPLNADAHIKALFMGNSAVVPVTGGRLDLGTWQRLILIEMDGPREREVQIMVQGDTAREGLKQYWEEKAKLIDFAIEPYLEKQWLGEALEASKYMHKGGKRIRGVLAILVSEALGGDPDKATDAAVAIEMIHSSTLAKDDVQDGDETRRGGLTAWMVYGIRKATALVDVTVPHALSIVRKYGTEAVYATIDAWREVGIGQVKDLFTSTFKGGRVYDEIVKNKTGTLFGLAATLGAIAAKADRAQKRLASAYGLRLGYAFQVIDDMMDELDRTKVPESFKAWLDEATAQSRLAETTQAVKDLALEFPESGHREYLVNLPETAYDMMVQETMAKLAAQEKEEKDNAEEGDTDE